MPAWFESKINIAATLTSRSMDFSSGVVPLALADLAQVRCMFLVGKCKGGSLTLSLKPVDLIEGAKQRAYKREPRNACPCSSQAKAHHIRSSGCVLCKRPNL